MKKQLLSMFLCIMVMLSTFPLTVSAADISEPIVIRTGTEQNPIVLSCTDTVNMKAQIQVDGGYVKISGGGTLLRDTSFINGSMISVSDGTLILEDITIDGNGDNIQTSEPGLRITGGTVVMTEETILQNHKKDTSSARGGAIEMDGGDFVMDGGVIQNNSARNYGGAVYLNDDATFTMNDGMVCNNATTYDAATYGGGAFYVKEATLTINGGTIMNNSTAMNGGGIYNTSYGTTIINGGTITGNKLTSESKSGVGIFHSCREGSVAVLDIGGKANIKDNVYLDGTTSAKFFGVTGQLENNLSLTCEYIQIGTVIAKGKNYTITPADMAKMTVTNSGKGLKLENNEISIADTTSSSYPIYFAYDANGGSGVPDAQEFTVTSTVPSKNVPIDFTAPTRTGYRFLGWDEDKDATTPTYPVGGVVTSITISENTTLYAIWESTAVQHTHAWSNDWTSDNTAHWHNCTADDCPIEDNADKDGYDPHNWATVYSRNDDEHWLECAVCDHEKPGSREPHDYADQYDGECTVCDMTREVPNRVNPLFRIPIYRLTFDTNGGSSIATQLRLLSNVVDLTRYAPTREGYTFTGWFFDEALTEPITETFRMRGNRTVYAGWAVVEDEVVEDATEQNP